MQRDLDGEQRSVRFCFSRSLSCRLRVPDRQERCLKCAVRCSGRLPCWCQEGGLRCPFPDVCLALTGESIPIRLFLAGYELTPTMRDINKKFSVRYYLNLVLIDEEERRYFKQQVRP